MWKPNVWFPRDAIKWVLKDATYGYLLKLYAHLKAPLNKHAVKSPGSPGYANWSIT